MAKILRIITCEVIVSNSGNVIKRVTLLAIVGSLEVT